MGIKLSYASGNTCPNDHWVNLTENSGKSKCNVEQDPMRWKIHTQYESQDQKRRERSGDLGVNESIILKSI